MPERLKQTPHGLTALQTDLFVNAVVTTCLQLLLRLPLLHIVQQHH
jgi:hypothetical protein